MYDGGVSLSAVFLDCAVAAPHRTAPHLVALGREGGREEGRERAWRNRESSPLLDLLLLFAAGYLLIKAVTRIYETPKYLI